jgi:hypothetical protein
VDTVLCEGKVLLRSGTFQTLDPADIFTRADRIRSVLAVDLKSTYSSGV